MDTLTEVSHWTMCGKECHCLLLISVALADSREERDRATGGCHSRGERTEDTEGQRKRRGRDRLERLGVRMDGE